MTEQWHPGLDDLYDILRGTAALTGSRVVARMAETVAKHPRADLAIAFNHKQIGSKLWLRDCLAEASGGQLGQVWVLGGWYGVLSAILLDDPRFAIAKITNIDLDPGCAAVAECLNRDALKAGRFAALTADMNALDYSARPDLVINTSCEHLPDVPGWLARLPKGQRVLLQSNNYFREPDHVSCVPDLLAFRAQAGLGCVEFAGERATKNYTRFMLVGRV